MSKIDSGSPASASRRAFTVQAVMALLAGYVITVTEACGSSSSPSQPSPPVADITGNISANHGHTATVTGAQITTGAQVSIDIRGQATHPHTIVLSGSDLNGLKNRQTVTVTSSNDNNHTHTVTFTPA